MRLAYLFGVALTIASLTVVADDFEMLREAIAREDYAGAMPALAAAADHNDPRALTLLAALYQQGRGVERDQGRAIELYTRAAALGDAEAEFNLGNIYLLGEGLKADEAWALTYYRQAASQGHEMAARNLAELYQAAGVAPPPATAEPPIAPVAADVARIQAEPALAPAAAVTQDLLAPASTPRSNPPNPGAVLRADNALTPAKVGGAPTEAAMQDELRAIELAKAHGIDVKLDPAVTRGKKNNDQPKAQPATAATPPVNDNAQAGSPVQAVNKAAPARVREQTSMSAVAAPAVPSRAAETTAEQRVVGADNYAAGRRYLHGDGVPRDAAKGAQLLQQAATDGNADAQFELAGEYLKGGTLAPDEAMAITLFRAAAASGHAQARIRLQQIYADAGLPMPALTRAPVQVAPGSAVHSAPLAGPKSAAGAAQALTPTAVNDASGKYASASITTPPVSPAAVADGKRRAGSAATTDPILAGAVAQAVAAARSTPRELPVATSVANAAKVATQPPTPTVVPEVVAIRSASPTSADPAPDPSSAPTPRLDSVGSASPPSFAPAVIAAVPATAVAVEKGAAGKLAAEKNRVAVPNREAADPRAIGSVAVAAPTTLQVAAVVPSAPVATGLLARIKGAFAVSAEGSNPIVSRAPGPSSPGMFATSALPVAAAASVPAPAPPLAPAPEPTPTVSGATATVPAGTPVKLAIAQAAEAKPTAQIPTLDDAKAALANGDLRRAAAKFATLANAGNADAQAHIGYMTYQGEGVARDRVRAVEWYRKSATQGNRDAQYNLAVAYAFGEGLAQNDAEAVQWYRRAAEQGSAIAQYSLGVSYALGEGVKRDDAEAAKWYRAAADQGYPAAEYNLAYMYRAGRGLAQSDSDALRWFLQAAQSGNASAQYSLGYLYRSGKGVERNLDEAIRWYKLAAAQGHSEARADLSTLAPAQ